MITSIVSPFLDHPLANRLRQTLERFSDCQCHGVIAWEQVETGAPIGKSQVVLVCLSCEQDLNILRKVRALHSGVVVAVAPILEPKFILKTLRNGADQFIDQEELETELNAVFGKLSNNQAKINTGRMIAILPASGGCGASTIAVNLAAVLASDQQPCGLIDLNPDRGDLATLLDLQPSFTLVDLCLNEPRLDDAMFEKMLAAHSSGVRLLAAPLDFSDVTSISAQGMVRALELAQRFFANTVVDLQDCFRDEQAATLQKADTIYLISRLDFTSIRNARRILDHLLKLDISLSHIKVVINQFGQTKHLPVEEAERALGDRLHHFVPYDAQTVGAANNTGVPAVLKSPKSKWTAAIQNLARLRLDEQAKRASPSKSSWFRLMELAHIV